MPPGLFEDTTVLESANIRDPTNLEYIIRKRLVGTRSAHSNSFKTKLQQYADGLFAAYNDVHGQSTHKTPKNFFFDAARYLTRPLQTMRTTGTITQDLLPAIDRTLAGRSLDPTSSTKDFGHFQRELRSLILVLTRSEANTKSSLRGLSDGQLLKFYAERPFEWQYPENQQRRIDAEKQQQEDQERRTASTIARSQIMRRRAEIQMLDDLFPDGFSFP
jgi:hypothetical protein